MKKVLSLLVAFVFLQTQSWAHSGGPDYGGAGVTLTGVYAGVLIPDQRAVALAAAAPVANQTAASIGLFSLGVPATGLATGACVIFINGDPFSGTITGVADPGKGTVVAIIDTISNFTVFNPLFPGIPFRLFATGQLKARIRQLANSLTPTGFTVPGSTRVEGTATLAVNGAIVSYIVDGFKQSDTTSAANTGGLGGIGAGGTGG